ncbi:unnamed protein product [Microthlaspi erraticum]|uniref:KIB1-4 beta-propeller domain-containing protein n=1 Tax=Microthlaspi erraticum TaxID=1685480 RepID=A0A6D2I4R0_9BRAS|nr:unnamed protein product [Microthlaspi erraticum]
MRPLLPRQTPPPSPAMKTRSPSSTRVSRKRSRTVNPRRRSRTVNPSFADLPSSLVEVIMSLLVLKDNIRASAACRSWREAGLSVRVVEKHPWLMRFPKRGNSFELRDPLQWKKHYTLELPELAGSTVCYSKDGWLLMHRASSNDIFFFNPFTRELVSFPKLEPSFLDIAFSCPPLSDNCVVLALDYNRLGQERMITISTCLLGATEWITTTEQFLDGSQVCYKLSKLVYVKDRFFCFDCSHGSGGYCMYTFHPPSSKWMSYVSPCLGRYDQRRYLYASSVYLFEKEGQLILMHTSGNDNPRVFKLSSFGRLELMWKIERDALTLFVSFYNSELRTNLPWMRNSVYFSRFGHGRKRCVSYSFDQGKYHPRNEEQIWRQRCPPQSIWINPPKNVLNYL